MKEFLMFIFLLGLNVGCAMWNVVAALMGCPLWPINVVIAVANIIMAGMCACELDN